MSSKSSGGAGISVIGVLFIIWLISKVPKEVWIFLAITAVIGGAVWVVYLIAKEAEESRAAKAAQERADAMERAAAAKREREERARREKQHRIDTLGKSNAAAVESALRAVKQVAASEAARAGWLGDVDFGPDIQATTENFEKAHALRAVTSKLSALKNPGDDDRRILAEAGTTIANLERVANDRLALIEKCSTEAQLIDKSLQTEREDAKVAGERAELHGKLSAMLYGIEAAPTSTPNDSAVDAVMARVQAYREIKNQLARECGFQTGAA